MRSPARSGSIRKGRQPDALRTMTGDEIAELIGQQVLIAARERQIDSVGVGFPGSDPLVELSRNHQTCNR